MFDEDPQQLMRATLLVVGAILPIVNPPGSAPMFLAMIHGADSKTRSALAKLPSAGIPGGTPAPRTSP